jgi:hypothetical protein
MPPSRTVRFIARLAVIYGSAGTFSRNALAGRLKPAASTLRTFIRGD